MVAPTGGANIKFCGYFLHLLVDRHRTSPEALMPVDIVIKVERKIAGRLCNQ